MDTTLVFLSVAWCSLLLAEAAPWANYETTERQACGDRLANIMSLVCSGRGYNNPFMSQHSSSRRYRRQIVEECCRRSCNYSMFELYCSAGPTEAPNNTPIRKRSDSEGYESPESQQGEESLASSTERPLVPTVSTHNSVTETRENDIRPTSMTKKPKHIFKTLNLLSTSEQSIHKQKKDDKSTQNDTTEEEFFKQNSIPPLRHRKNHHHSRQLRGRKSSGKTKRDKSASGESWQSFQIGTVKPYFAGKALVSYHSNYVRHAPPQGS